VIKLKKDFSEFLRLLNANGVRYIIVGGYAVIYHGGVRTTGNLDIWVSPHGDNPERLAKCLQEFGFDLPEVNPGLFLGKEKIIRMGVTPVRIEIIMEIDGVEFEECYPRRVFADLEDFTAPFISLPDLIANKRASGRHKDLADVEQLQQLIPSR
jgi:hypothetical protein